MKSLDRSRGGRIWLLLLLILVAIFFSPALHLTFIFRDAFNLFYPYKAVEAGYLRSFTASLWNPYETMGSSFVGELATGWFYPGNVFYMVAPPELALRLFIVSHYFLAAWFMWLWLTKLGVGPAGAVCGALSYTLSGYVVSQNGLPDMLATCAWTPGTLWLLMLAMERARVWPSLLFGASLAMPLLAGRAEGVILNGLAAAGQIAILGGTGRGFSAEGKRALKVFAVGALAALGIAMIQLLPSYELGRLSTKGGGFGLAEATLWSLHPKRLLEFVLASPWGRFWPEQTYTGWELTGWKGFYPWSITHYLGVGALIGAASVCARASRRRVALTIGALLLAVLFSLGDHFFLFGLAYKLFPPFRIFRYPEKFMALVALILAAAGAAGIDGWFRLERGERPGKTRGDLIVLAMMLVVFILLVCWLLDLVPASISKSFGPGWDRWRWASAPHLICIVSLLLIYKPLSRWLLRPWARGALMVGIVFLDLSLANSWVIPYAAKEIYGFEPASLTIIRDHARAAGLDLFDATGRGKTGRYRVLREQAEPSEAALAMMEGASRLERYRRYERHTLKQNFNFICGLEDLIGYTAAATADFDRVMRSSLNVKMMELFNVRYAISPARGSYLEGQGLPVAGARPEMGFKVFELPGAFPRAYLIGRSRRTPRAMDSLELLSSHDFRAAAVIEDHLALPGAAEETDLPLTAVTMVEHSPERARIKTAADRAAYLVLSDSFFPGWRATLDGRPTPIFRANFLCRATWVPAGEHEVEFIYEPSMYRSGKLISLFSIFTMMAAIGVEAVILRHRRAKK